MSGRTMKHRTAFVAIGLMVVTSAANAQVKSLKIVSHRPPEDVLPGYIVNDLFIDFDGLYTGSQMIVELDIGEIFQDTSPFAGDYSPIPAAISLDPRIQWDTFLANGGPTAADNASSFIRGEGAAINVDPSRRHPSGSQRPAVFSSEDIDVQWNPAGGADITERMDFMVARLTLTEGTWGILQFIASADQVIGVPHAMSINGSFPGEQVPGGAPGERRVTVLITDGVAGLVPCEPSTVMLLGVGVMGTAGVRATKRRFGRAHSSIYRSMNVCTSSV